MQIEHQHLRVLRDEAAFELLNLLSQFYRRQSQEAHTGTVSKWVPQGPEDQSLARYQRHQQAWMDVFGVAPAPFVDQVLGVAVQQFPFVWGHFHNASSLGRHIDAAHAKWSQFCHSSIGNSETDIQARLYALVHAGATDVSLGQMLQDLGKMPAVFARHELGSALTLALALDHRRKGVGFKSSGIVRQFLPVYDRAIAHLQSTRIETAEAIAKAQGLGRP